MNGFAYNLMKPFKPFFMLQPFSSPGDFMNRNRVFFRQALGRNDRSPFSALLILAGLLTFALLWAAPTQATAATDETTTASGTQQQGHQGQHQHQHAPQMAPDNTQVGINEQLGANIPLGLTFRDEEGRPVTLRELISGPTIIAPVYYSCPNVCAFLQADLARNLPLVKLQPGPGYRVLSVSFDERDTPAAARAARKTYLTAMGRPFPAEAWRFLTGDAEASRALTAAAGYRYLRQGDDFLHPVVIFVVTGEGRIVRYLHGTRMLPMDLTLALTEAKQGRLGSTIRKVVRFCFSYDPQQKHYVFNLLRIAATVILVTAGGFLLFLFISGRKR